MFEALLVNDDDRCRIHRQAVCRTPPRQPRGTTYAGMGFALAVMCLAMDGANAGGGKVYVSQGRGDRLPVYTDRPIDGTSQVVISTSRSITRGAIPAVWRTPARHVGVSMDVRRRVLEPLIERTAHVHGVEPALLYALIEVESGFNIHAVSPAGARGLAQVMPATAARYGQYNLFSPEQNVEVGTRYLRDLLKMFDGNIELALAAYNAGENAVIRFGRRIPPYPETQKYVPNVLMRYHAYRGKSGPVIADP